MARFVGANGLRFAVHAEGPTDGPLALLAHGFPDTPHTWRYLRPALVARGYRVVAPWMRGYGPSEAPSPGPIHRGTLAADLNSLHRELGGDGRAVLVGHDWGSIAAAAAATAAPTRWSQVVLLAVPPEPAMAGAVRDPRQLARSSYTALLALPGAHRRLARDDLALLETLWRRWSPGHDPSEDLVHVRSSLRDAVNLRAVLGYYRGLQRDLFARRYPRPTAPVPPQPTLYLHGAEDGCIAPTYADAARPLLSPGSRVEVLPRVGHFLHLEAPDDVAALVTSFLSP